MFSWRTEVRPGTWVAFTDAGAGNLALHVGDDPADVRRRRDLLEAASGIKPRRFQYMNQVHGSDVLFLETSADAHDTAVPTADGLVSRGMPLAVMVADCVPVVMVAEPPSGTGSLPILAAVHAGRPGVAAGIVPGAIHKMRDAGAVDIRAWIGPSICGSCYEVPGSMRDSVTATVPAAWSETSWGTPGLDLPAGVRSQLEADGVAIEYSGQCTLENESLYSYRRNRHTGRFAGLVWTHE
ncbi:polyphenol oxidase family protein [Arthrobacter sp.]|uniref:polyphenol oxidase family protein n=1 Tax=Arthrobacter sp. TaxID=1667 RepID=UPI002811CC9D|nr:polyphenol oxidase family protein [Arthrobacter sp.]